MEDIAITAVLKDIIKYRTFLAAVVKRDIRSKYYRSVLGMVWTLLNPMLMTLVLSIVFTTLFSGMTPNFPLYYLTGFLLFNFNSEATTFALSTISKNGSIIRKIYIPKYMFCISDITVSFINMMFAFIPLVIVAIFSDVRITWLWLLIPGLLLLQIMFTFGLSLVIAAYGVIFKDLAHLYGIFTMMWMYLSAIFYPVSIIDPKFVFIWEINPMIHYIGILRSLVYSVEMPSLRSVAIAAAYSVIMFLLGCVVFNEKQDSFFLHI
jgi:ABC-2 type transport system permease protein